MKESIFFSMDRVAYFFQLKYVAPLISAFRSNFYNRNTANSLLQ